MGKDLHKRLEEAAMEYASIQIADHITERRIKEAYLSGAELGYKEAISLAKEWLDKEWDEALFNLSLEECLKKFESDMNKLWEGEK